MGGGGGGDDSASIVASQNQMLIEMINAVNAENERKKQAAEDAANQAAWMDSYNRQQEEWKATLNAQNEAMQRVQDEATRKADEMRAALEAEAAEQARLAEEARLAAEQADKIATMKTGMASDSTAELDAQNTLKKRRASLQPLTTLLTTGSGLTSAAPTQAKTLLGQ